MIVRTMQPWNAQRAGSECDRKNKHHIFTPTAGACSTIPKLCMLVEDVDAIKTVPIIFDPTLIFSYGKFRGK